MLQIISNRLTPQAEKIIDEEQAGFRAGRSISGQIFNLAILCQKYQHQQDHYSVSVDFKKIFDGVWHAALLATMKRYNISANVIDLSNTSITRLPVQSSSATAQQNYSVQQLESFRDVYSHLPSSKYFWKGS